MIRIKIVTKRLVDIILGIIGCVVTIFLFIILSPIFYVQSPGPIFFSQKRVGKDGKIFTIYKFRTMCVNAENQQVSLMKDNVMSGRQMFRVSFDHRVIGNHILPDGTKKTGIGEFLRKTGLDEFPQFLNVLKGEMSCVGPRPALISEVKEYEPHHMIRLSVKPGITGLWQVSGRERITDFDEVVKLDAMYIKNWNLWLDFKIMIETIKIILKGERE